MEVQDDNLMDDHMRLLEWLDEHPGGSLTAAAEALGLDVAEVEAIFADLVAEGMIEQLWEQ
jgi:DNA-binding IclR family transcriptional regulator